MTRWDECVMETSKNGSKKYLKWEDNMYSITVRTKNIIIFQLWYFDIFFIILFMILICNNSPTKHTPLTIFLKVFLELNYKGLNFRLQMSFIQKSQPHLKQTLKKRIFNYLKSLSVSSWWIISFSCCILQSSCWRIL